MQKQRELVSIYYHLFKVLSYNNRYLLQIIFHSTYSTELGRHGGTNHSLRYTLLKMDNLQFFHPYCCVSHLCGSSLHMAILHRSIFPYMHDFWQMRILKGVCFSYNLVYTPLETGVINIMCISLCVCGFNITSLYPSKLWIYHGFRVIKYFEVQTYPTRE